MQALELMKTHVVKTTPDATLSEVVDLMDLYQVAGLPVVNGEGELCGMITERDVVQAMQAAKFADGDEASTTTQPLCGMAAADIEQVLSAISSAIAIVQDFMTTPAIFVLEQADVREAAQIMLGHGLKRLPVVDERGRIVGILNRSRYLPGRL